MQLGRMHRYVFRQDIYIRTYKRAVRARCSLNTEKIVYIYACTSTKIVPVTE